MSQLTIGEATRLAKRTQESAHKGYGHWPLDVQEVLLRIEDSGTAPPKVYVFQRGWGVIVQWISGVDQLECVMPGPFSAFCKGEGGNRRLRLCGPVRQ